MGKKHSQNLSKTNLASIKKKKNKKQKHSRNDTKSQHQDSQSLPDKPSPKPPPTASRGSGILAKFRQKLQGGQFRWLNEQLYTSEGDQALKLMQDKPELYQHYHQGEFVVWRSQGGCVL